MRAQAADAAVTRIEAALASVIFRLDGAGENAQKEASAAMTRTDDSARILDVELAIGKLSADVKDLAERLDHASTREAQEAHFAHETASAKIEDLTRAVLTLVAESDSATTTRNAGSNSVQSATAALQPARTRTIVPDHDLSFLRPELRPLASWTVALHEHGTDIVSDQVSQDGSFERHVMATIAAALGGPAKDAATRRTFLDVGANIGFHTLFVLALGHRVLAVEPFRRNAALIRASVSMNEGFSERLTLYKYALSDSVPSNGTGLCMVSTEQTMNKGNARLVKLSQLPTADEAASGTCVGRWLRTADTEVWQEHADGEGVQVGERVSVSTLDLLVPRDTSVDVLKADIEGYEARALLGATALFARKKPCVVVFEYNAYVTAESGVDANALARDLFGRGYRLFLHGNATDITPKMIGNKDPPFGSNGDYVARLKSC